MSSLWIGIGTIAVGAAGAIYGADKQRKLAHEAQDANVAAQDKQNNLAWGNYLMSRGIAPNSPVEPGVMPGPGGYSAVNTKLPIWANVNFGTSAKGSNGAFRLVKKGTPRTTGIMGLAPVGASSMQPVPVGGGGIGGGYGGGGNIAASLMPSNNYDMGLGGPRNALTPISTSPTPAYEGGIY